MRREEKSDLISALQSSLKEANGVFVIENHGLTVKEMEALRVHAEAKYTEPLPNNRRLEVRSRSILASADPSLSSKNDRDGDK